MAVITVSREKGSEGRFIAERTAELLGYHFVDKNIMERLLAEYGIGEFWDEYHSLPSFWARFSERGERREVMMDVLRRATLALAHHGNVLMMGRGCYGVLGGYADVINVRIQAPVAIRVERIMRKEQMDRSSAEEYVKQSDEVRTAFVRSCYGIWLDNASLFDLVIDTDKIPADMAVEWVVRLAKHISQAEHTGKPTKASIEPDVVLMDAVSEVLSCKASHS